MRNYNSIVWSLNFFVNVHKKVCKRAKIRSTDSKRICKNSRTSTVNNFIDISESDENNSVDNS